MKSLVFSAKQCKVNVKDVPIPADIGPDDVLVKVAYAGVCGSDLTMMRGDFYISEQPQLILGHEFSGTVEKVSIPQETST